MRIAGIIPARYNSTRFKGKPLAIINGKPMIQWVYERALASNVLHDLVVATDDVRIQQCVKEFGGNVVMTGMHESGTDRCAEAAGNVDAEVIINIQGDEPMLATKHLELLVTKLQGRRNAQIATLCKRIYDATEVANPNVVKVVTANNNKALYFSRLPIPFQRDTLEDGIYYKHIGLYAFKKEVLTELSNLPPGMLEQAEKLEQLRWLEAGYEIYVAETSVETVSIDTPEDITRLPLSFQ